MEEHNLVEDIKVWVQWKVYREHQVCFMLVAGKDRQFIKKVNKTDALAALLKGIHLPVLQMQPCPGQGANVFHDRDVQVQHCR